MEARVKGDMDAVEEMMVPDYVGHTKMLPGQEPGRERRIWTPRRPSKYVCLETIP
jgi:hypothetical protein